MDNDARAPPSFTREDAMHSIIRALFALSFAAMLACGGDAEQTDSATGAVPDTGGVAPTPQQGGATAADPSEITADMVALGNEIFHGRQANGICYTCHGMDATGGPGGLGPNLTDDQWLHSDGSYGGIINTIRTGVPQPVNAPAPMGGAPLSEEQVRAVAAYVYSLTHPDVAS
jgi:mono/diheme cytochrome c family protein